MVLAANLSRIIVFNRKSILIEMIFVAQLAFGAQQDLLKILAYTFVSLFTSSKMF